MVNVTSDIEHFVALFLDNRAVEEKPEQRDTFILIFILGDKITPKNAFKYTVSTLNEMSRNPY